MIHVIQKWNVRIVLEGGAQDFTFKVSDDHLANVLRTVAVLDFGREESCHIERVKSQTLTEVASGETTGSVYGTIVR